MPDPSDIHPVYGVPREMLICPGCGKLYVNKVCLRCEECKRCCTCTEPSFVSAHAAKKHIAEHESLPPLPES